MDLDPPGPISKIQYGGCHLEKSRNRDIFIELTDFDEIWQDDGKQQKIIKRQY